MPSLAYMNEPSPPPVLIPSSSSSNNNNSFINNNNNHTTNNNNRHRSGSLTLPVPTNLHMSNMFSNNNNNTNNTWQNNNSTLEEPISPSTEQLLQGDDDFSIARTLRSIGLDEDSNSIRPAAGRNRSYSVNNTALYQQQSRVFPSLTPPPPPPMIGNRRRASSMGRMDYNRLTPPGLSSLWQMQLGTLHDEDYDSQSNSTTTQEPSLSLGDSELLANMLQQQDVIPIESNNGVNHSNNIMEVSLYYGLSTVFTLLTHYFRAIIISITIT